MEWQLVIVCVLLGYIAGCLTTISKRLTQIAVLYCIANKQKLPDL